MAAAGDDDVAVDGRPLRLRRQPRETWPEKHVFAKQLESDVFVRDSFRTNKSQLLRWTSPETVGIASLKALSLNVQVIKICLEVWGSVSALPKAMAIDWLKEVMTEAWGEDPGADDDPEDDAPADALMDAVPNDDPYAAAADEAGSSQETAVLPGAPLQALVAEMNDEGSDGASHEALSGEPNQAASYGLEALLAELNETGEHGASREALLGEPNGTGSPGASHEALLREPNGTGSHGASHEALDSELESIAAKMQVLQNRLAQRRFSSGSFDPSNEDTLPSNIMDLPHIMNNGDEKLVVQILSDDEETEAPEVLSSAVADDGKDSSAADVAPTEPETKLSEAAEAAGDDDGQPDDESFDVANYEDAAEAGEAEVVAAAVGEAQEEEKPKPKAKATPKAKGSKTARKEPEPKASGKDDDKEEEAQADEGTKKRRRLAADDKSFAGRPKPKTEDATNRFMAIRDVYNSKIQLHFGASQQELFF
ncbi:unnamed protein product [Symbiodinium sp. CCMP2456]|nr:unnamed protein product [Symbiodinium sp. CCMP2456]